MHAVTHGIEAATFHSSSEKLSDELVCVLFDPFVRLPGKVQDGIITVFNMSVTEKNDIYSQMNFIVPHYHSHLCLGPERMAYRVCVSSLHRNERLRLVYTLSATNL